eukprot:TRINITY_DN26607_c0_g1_i2.p1 TRINITY_DN26607_c0_g1~~TRINITY_DN26607_c0_g1_i2.p1  ORF type:complete len:177 (+),score=17.40 TRINITY_DN26607_c0_g1_i2:211-741(+)
MVSLGVPTAYFGPKFGTPVDPDKKDPPHYPSVPYGSCDALGAIKIYRDICKKERDIRGTQTQLHLEHPGQVIRQRRGNDLLPGLGSINETYEHLGFTVDPVSRRSIAPQLRNSPRTASAIGWIASNVPKRLRAQEDCKKARHSLTRNRISHLREVAFVVSVRQRKISLSRRKTWYC